MKHAKTLSIYSISSICFAIIILAGCAPKAEVKIQLIETLTSLESQVLGTYKQIGQEAWLISSVRDSSKLRSPLSPSKKEVFAAIENQEFNADDIAEFKDAGVVGESSEAALVIRESPRFRRDTSFVQLVNEIVAEENNDRGVIIRRIIMENPQLKEADVSAVKSVFARIYWQKAAPNHWLLTAKNQWLMKKDWSPKSTGHEK